MIKLYSFSYGLLFVSLLCCGEYAQAQNDSQILNETAQTEIIESEIPVPINDFENIRNVDEVVFQLRNKYGVKGSVALTKTLWQILTSYSDQQQAENVWQSAVKQWQSVATEIKDDIEVLDSEPVAKQETVEQAMVSPHVSVINAQYNAGRVLTRHSHGMTIDKWNSHRQLPKISKQNIADFFTMIDETTIYFALTDVWQVLLDDLEKQQEIRWKTVFLDSLVLFDEPVGASVSTIDEGNENQEIVEIVGVEVIKGEVFFDLLKSLQSDDDKKHALAQLAAFIDKQHNFEPYFYQTIMRFVLDKSHKHYLATSQSWFVVAEQLYFYKNRMSAEMLEKVLDFIEENDAWFLAKEQQLLAINEQLPLWVETSVHALKGFYNGSSDTNQANLMTIYQVIVDDFDKYMDNPFRRKIQKNLEVCLNISEEFAPFPQQPIDKKQFFGCIQDMVIAATEEGSVRELSGSLTKVDSQQALDRALQLPAWQIINILYANSAENNCLKESDQLANPLEWTLATESLLWFADRWPTYMRNYSQQTEIQKVVAAGQKLIEEHNCLEKSEQQILDAQFTQIMQSWQNVKAQIRQLIVEFNAVNLTEGSDINLLENVEKNSNYRVENLSIMECDSHNACGVHTEFESSRALFGLFPNHLLVADQLKLGSLKLCYDHVGWEHRRPASTHLNNDNVANYFGHLSFSLKGFYNDELVFERKLIDSQEYLYLFAENNDEVAEIYCPLPIVGNNIATELKEGTFGLVPNRLTFLTASRTNETEILEQNWSKGQEWRDKISAEEGQVMYFNDLSGLSTEVNQAYQAKAAELQDLIYQTLLGRKTEPTDTQAQLTVAFNNMQRSKAIFSALNYFLNMDDLMVNDALHGMLFGQDKIADVDVIKAFYQNQTNINLLISSIDDNMKRNEESWFKSQEHLSHSHIASALFRLQSIKP